MAHAFMLADIAGSLLAVCLFPLFVLIPGFAIAWALDLFDFRRRTTEFQLALTIPLSIAVCPALTFLAGRFAAMTAVWLVYAALWIYALAVVIRHPPVLPRKPWPQILILATWALLAIFSLVDLQIGTRAWFPAAAFDYSIRAQFIHSIDVSGIPPGNPFFLPGHPVPLRYHYFWLLLCSLVNRAGGPWISARHAWIGGAVWCGFGLMAIVALFFRLFAYRGPATFRRRAYTGILLLTVTGLDILPTALLWALQASGMQGVFPSMEWWNEQVDGFVYTALWESHYLAGLIACLMAFLILWNAGRPARKAHAVLAGIALASAAGSSIYVAFVFGMFLFIWMAASMTARRWNELAHFATAGAVAAICFLPYAIALRGPAMGGPVLQFWIRPFYPIDALFDGQGIHGWARAFANGFALPLNYFLELGFFFVAAIVWYQRRRTAGTPLSRVESATLLMIATSVTLCTFLRSSVIGNNDLGWRGFLIAQFALLLLAVDVAGDPRTRRGFLSALLVLGLLGSAYELAINRFYPLLADRGTVALRAWIAPDHQAGTRNYAIREAAEWAAASTARNAVVQYNPHVALQNTSALLYSARQMLAADDHCLSTFGGDQALCPALIGTLNRIYPPAGRSADPALDGVCRALPVDLIGAVDTDPAWADRGSWVWNAPPVFTNRNVRLFRCQNQR